MFTNSTVESTVKSVIESFDFEKVSDLTKEQFSEIISKSIYKTVTSGDFMEKIYSDLNMRLRRMR